MITSSAVTVAFPAPENIKKIYTDKDWSEPNGRGPYEKSKIFAERAAWDYVNNLPPSERFELVVLNPGFVGGPCYQTANQSSSEMAA